MADYIRAGDTIEDYFDYATTGLTQSDFTIIVDKDDTNVANTGVTITNVATTRYYVECSGSTSFSAGTGVYKLTILRTAVPGDKWQMIYRVTSDGTAAGTSGGTTGFTSTTSDGRITDGSTAIENATVTITRPSAGGYYARLTTNASGNWGPVYFDGDGTWQFTVQASGYTVGSGSITVSSGIPTGPGADVALTAIASTTLTLSTLQAYARRMYRDRTGSKIDAEITQAINESLMMVASDNDWPWYHTMGTITFRAIYQAGSVSLTNGSTAVVLSGGTFPYQTVGVNGVVDLYINGMPRRLASITDGTNAVLATAWTETSYSGAYVMAQSEYNMPSDLLRLMYVSSVSTWVWGPTPVSRYDLEIARQQWRISSSQPPVMWAVERDRICIWPAPSTDQQVNMLYLRKPAELTSGSDLADWDTNLIGLLRRAIDYQISCRGDCVAGDKASCYQSYKEELARSIDQDRRAVVWTPGLSRGVVSDLRYNAVIT